jgi:hypothetical protein
MLKRQGLITVWSDRKLVAGDPIDDAIREQMVTANVILLLVSADFLASDYCYGKEMTLALERHSRGEARVIPIILRPCDWQDAPFSKLLAAPTDGKPVSKWPDPDEAFLAITKSIRTAIDQLSRSAPIRDEDFIPALAAAPVSTPIADPSPTLGTKSPNGRWMLVGECTHTMPLRTLPGFLGKANTLMVGIKNKSLIWNPDGNNLEDHLDYPDSSENEAHYLT